MNEMTFDLWASVSGEKLPTDLTEAVSNKDWHSVASELQTIMDGAVTDGVYGRALLQLVRALPLGKERLIDRYKAVVSIDYGDWDGLRACLADNTIARSELIGMREILLAPINQMRIPPFALPHEAMLFGSYEYQFSQMLNRFRHWARGMLRFQATDVVWERPDVPAGRHFRYRKLQDAVFLAFAEAQGGNLPTAAALAIVLSAGPRGVAHDTGAAPVAAPAPAPVPLELVALGHERDGDRLTVRGVVRNPAAGAEIDGVTAVVFLFNRDGGFLASGVNQ